MDYQLLYLFAVFKRPLIYSYSGKYFHYSREKLQGDYNHSFISIN